MLCEFFGVFGILFKHIVMVRHIYERSDFLGDNKRLIYIHIAKSAVDTYEGTVGLIF